MNNKWLPLAFLSACINPADVQQLKSNQTLIEQRLAAIEKRLTPASQPAPKIPEEERIHAFEIGDAPTRGPDDAWVTIVVVSNFQCPYCKRVNATLEQIFETYKNDVRLVFKHNPLKFHVRSMPAAIAAECAHEQGRFWQMHDLIFEDQRNLSDDDLRNDAKRAGLDLKRWDRCVEEERPKAKIERSQRAAGELGANGTPAFFINGAKLSGAQPFSRFQSKIDNALIRAKNSGIPKARYYQLEVMKKGQKKF